MTFTAKPDLGESERQVKTGDCHHSSYQFPPATETSMWADIQRLKSASLSRLLLGFYTKGNKMLHNVPVIRSISIQGRNLFFLGEMYVNMDSRLV